MKQMILTGLATEQSFNNPEPRCFLVFNNGELRVPVSQEAAEVIIGQMLDSPKSEEVEEEDPRVYEDTEELLDEDGIGQV